MAEWTHLFSYRTQKLSIPAATIVGPAPCEDSSLPVPFSDHTIAFFVFSCTFVYNGLCIHLKNKTILIKE